MGLQGFGDHLLSGGDAGDGVDIDRGVELDAVTLGDRGRDTGDVGAVGLDRRPDEPRTGDIGGKHQGVAQTGVGRDRGIELRGGHHTGGPGDAGRGRRTCLIDPVTVERGPPAPGTGPGVGGAGVFGLPDPEGLAGDRIQHRDLAIRTRRNPGPARQRNRVGPERIGTPGLGEPHVIARRAGGDRRGRHQGDPVVVQVGHPLDPRRRQVGHPGCTLGGQGRGGRDRRPQPVGLLEERRGGVVDGGAVGGASGGGTQSCTVDPNINCDIPFTIDENCDCVLADEIENDEVAVNTNPLKDGCIKLNAITDNVDVKQKLASLITSSNNNSYEEGFKIVKYQGQIAAGQIENDNSSNAPDCQAVSITAHQQVSTIVHSHPVNCNVFGMFSDKDIMNLAQIAKLYNDGDAIASNNYKDLTIMLAY